MLPDEPEILAARLAFSEAQAALAGVGRSIGVFDIGWYGTTISDERGSFALVSEGSDFEQYIGDVVALASEHGVAYAYVVGSYPDLPYPVCVTRRVFLALETLAEIKVAADVEVIL